MINIKVMLLSVCVCVVAFFFVSSLVRLKSTKNWLWVTNYTFFFYKQLHLWVQPRVAKAFLQFQPQSCLMVASSVQISAVVAYELLVVFNISALVANGLLDETRSVIYFLMPPFSRFHFFGWVFNIFEGLDD